MPHGFICLQNCVFKDYGHFKQILRLPVPNITKKVSLFTATNESTLQEDTQ